MVMPFIRLLAIYAAVIIGISAFFQRDRIMDLAGFSSPEIAQEDMAEMPEVEDDTSAEMAAEADSNAEHVQQPESAENTEELSAAAILEQSEVNSSETETRQTIPVARPATATSTAEQLNNARKAYWEGDMPGAEKQYRAIIKTTPDSVDANGELGNILYAQGRYTDAAEFYFATGKILINNGNSQQALPIFQILLGIAPDRAATLRALATQ